MSGACFLGRREHFRETRERAGGRQLEMEELPFLAGLITGRVKTRAG